MEFDHLLDSARTIARETEGVTLAFEPDAYGDGTEVRVLAPGSNGTLTPTTLPIFHTRAAIEETESLGKAPFAFLIHATGSLGGRPGFRRTAPTPPAEVGCPASGSFHFTIRTAGTTADRFIPCRITLAANGPITFATWPPATAAPVPTPCVAVCSATTLPIMPTPAASCPPRYSTVQDGCVLPTSMPQYHVTATLASPTMDIGSGDSIIAEARLLNPTATANGIPNSVPIAVQLPGSMVCTVAPLGPQPSGSTFALSAKAAGPCQGTIVADVTSVPGATADTASFNITILTSQAAQSPPPRSCDLLLGGRCYLQIVPRTVAEFRKDVLPDSTCTDTADGTVCSYLDSIKQISLGSPFEVQPKVPPLDANHELLYRIDAVTSVGYFCESYPYFAVVQPPNAIQWPGIVIGGPADAPIGFGEPNLFFTKNILVGATTIGSFPNAANPWATSTSLMNIYEAVAQNRIGAASTFSYSSPDATTLSTVQWYPDFPGCDASGDPNAPAARYGSATVLLAFEVYQAIP
jgi:hypothetical protein